MGKKKTPEYILDNNPSHWQLERILRDNDNSAIKEKALQTALNSGDISKISLIFSYVPEGTGMRTQALRACLDVEFTNAAPSDCPAILEKHKNWALLPEWRNWWLDWESKLQRRMEIHEAEVARALAEWDAQQAEIYLFKKAQSAGQDVCEKCRTIEPQRCDYCNACMVCEKDTQRYCYSCRNINLCGDPTCGGWCYICADDDDD